GHVVLPGMTRTTTGLPDSSPASVAFQDESFTIAAINGNQVTLNHALTFNHTPPTTLNVPLVYQDRNVLFTSENTTVLSRRGHVMIMHDGGADVFNAEFLDLGRTSALSTVTDPALNPDGTVVAGSDANVRGRYALHFHRTGSTGAAATVNSVSVVDNG